MLSGFVYLFEKSLSCLGYIYLYFANSDFIYTFVWFSGCSAVRLARQLRELEVPSSNLGIPTKTKANPFAGLALIYYSKYTYALCTSKPSTWIALNGLAGQ